MPKGANAWAVLALKFVIVVLYTQGVLVGTIKPTLPSWCIFTVSVTLVFITAITSGVKPLENLSNTADVFLVIFLTIVSYLWGKGDNMAWKPVDVGSGALSAVVLIYWWQKRKDVKRNIRANLAMQFVMCLAFVPLLNNLWRATESPESPLYWAIVVVGELLALRIAIKAQRGLSIAYSARAVTFATVAYVLILRLQYWR